MPAILRNVRVLWIGAALLVACGSSHAAQQTAARTEEPRGETREPPIEPSVTLTPQDDASVDGWRMIDVASAIATAGRGGPPFVTGVWGAAPDDVFVVGNDGIILHFDGREWTPQPGPRGEHYGGVWGHSGEVFVVGMQAPEGGIVRHYDGRSWSLQPTPPTVFLSGLWGSAPDDVFSVGAEGSILHFDGERWRAQPSGTTQTLHGVWGSGPTDVLAVGDGGTILHYDGHSWSPHASGTSAHLRGIWGSSRTDVFVAGDELVLHYDGRTWTSQTFERAFLRAVSGTGPTDAIAVGSNGVIMRFDGRSWSRNPQTLLQGSFRSVGGGNIHALDASFTRDLTSAWSTGPSHIVAVGRGSIYTLEGNP